MNETWGMGSYRDIAEELFLSDFWHVWGNSHRTFEGTGIYSQKEMSAAIRRGRVWARWNGNGREIKWSLRLLPPGTKLRTTRSSLLDPHKYPDLSVFSQISPIHTSPRWPPQIKLLQSMLPFHQWQCLQNLAPRRNLILSILEVCRVWILLVDSNSPERSMQALLQQ